MRGSVPEGTYPSFRWHARLFARQVAQSLSVGIHPSGCNIGPAANTSTRPERVRVPLGEVDLQTVGRDRSRPPAGRLSLLRRVMVSCTLPGGVGRKDR